MKSTKPSIAAIIIEAIELYVQWSEFSDSATDLIFDDSAVTLLASVSPYLPEEEVFTVTIEHGTEPKRDTITLYHHLKHSTIDISGIPRDTRQAAEYLVEVLR